MSVIDEKRSRDAWEYVAGACGWDTVLFDADLSRCEHVYTGQTVRVVDPEHGQELEADVCVVKIRRKRLSLFSWETEEHLMATCEATAYARLFYLPPGSCLPPRDWRFAASGSVGEVTLFGVDVFEHRWRKMMGNFYAPDPFGLGNESFPVYKMAIKRREPGARSPFAYTEEAHMFAAKESPDGRTWRFYVLC